MCCSQIPQRFYLVWAFCCISMGDSLLDSRNEGICGGHKTQDGFTFPFRPVSKSSSRTWAVLPQQGPDRFLFKRQQRNKKRNSSFWKCFQEPPLPFCPLSTAGFSLLGVISFEPLYQFPQHLQGFNLLMPLFAFIPEAFPLSALSFSFLDLSRLWAVFGVNARRALGCPGEWSLAVV